MLLPGRANTTSVISWREGAFNTTLLLLTLSSVGGGSVIDTAKAANL